MAWKATADPLRFAEAVEWFRARVPVTDAEYKALTEAARKRAVTVAGVTQADVVADVMKAVDAALRNGTGLEEFKAKVGPKLQNAWGKDAKAPAWRLENIFRTNVQSAYAAGRYQQQTHPDTLASRPYWLYDAVLDTRTSSVCRALHGTLLPADHPKWLEIYPPNHFGGCRSGVRTLSARQAAARGGVTEVPSQSPDAAWRTVPSLTDWDPDVSNYPEDLQPALRRKLAGK